MTCKICEQWDLVYTDAVIRAEAGLLKRDRVLELSRRRWNHKVEAHGCQPPAAPTYHDIELDQAAQLPLFEAA